MSESEFAGLGLAMGQVTGARSFLVDGLGRLTGIHYKQVWRPGENVAECRRKDDDSMAATLRRIDQSIAALWAFDMTPRPSVAPITGGRKRGREKVVMVPTTRIVPPVPVAPVEPKPHTMGDCSCGFYGYYDGSDDYYKDGLVSGVVEGYGEALIGTRGFRVGK